MSRFARFLILLALLSTLSQPLPTQAAPASPAATNWYDGLIQYSTITNCFSIIQGFPYQENGVGTYVGFLSDPEAGQPSPNNVYYVHVIMAGLGNACSGQLAYLDLQLPANTTLAIDGTNPVYCLYDNVSQSGVCPQAFQNSSYNSGSYWIPLLDPTYDNLWPIPTGHTWEIQIPVRSSTALTNSQLQAHVWVLDGNSSPWLHPQQGVYVFSSEPTILYPSPATITITASTATSYAYLYAFGLGGTAYFDLGTTTSYGLFSDQAVIPAGGTAWKLWTDWTPFALQADALYHYRLRFVASNGQTYFGADQTFQTLPSGQATVGNGQAASCTATALAAALGSADSILFDCGSQPVNITLSNSQAVSGQKAIDGGNKVTLLSPAGGRHFLVQPGGELTLKNITLRGSAINVCGGSVYVDANASLVTDGARFIENSSSGYGGALCVGVNGQALIYETLFISNTALNGGAIWNYGTLEIYNSNLSGNEASSGSGMGGGVGNHTGAAFGAAYSLFSGNSAAHGGGIYGGSVLYHSTVSGNRATVNGGGIEGDLWMSNVTIANNQVLSGCTMNCDGEGGGVYGNVTLQNTIIAGNLPHNCPSGILTPVVFSNGHNLSSDPSCNLTGSGDQSGANPLLGPLQNNGGVTHTYDLLAGSPAIDAGDNALCVSHDGTTNNVTDQRGVARPIDGDKDGNAVCDIGAVEFSQFVIHVERAGSGSGTVTSDPAGIACGLACSAAFEENTQVTLQATPNVGSSFTGWSGACSGTGSCVVTMDDTKNVVATFTAAPTEEHTLAVTLVGSGSGVVSSSPAGISCGSDCTEDYAHGTLVTLAAAANSGSTFTGWSGACSGVGSCVVTMDDAKNVTASFTVTTSERHTLTVTLLGSGSGAVGSDPAGISCGSDCSEEYAHGMLVTLAAVASEGSTFTGWGGACSGTAACVVTMDVARDVTASFRLDAAGYETFIPLIIR